MHRPNHRSGTFTTSHLCICLGLYATDIIMPQRPNGQLAMSSRRDPLYFCDAAEGESYAVRRTLKVLEDIDLDQSWRDANVIYCAGRDCRDDSGRRRKP